MNLLPFIIDALCLCCIYAGLKQIKSGSIIVGIIFFAVGIIGAVAETLHNAKKINGK